MKTCIVNYISGGGWRPYGQKRLQESLGEFGYKGDVLLFNEKTLSCPPHSQTPYAFKLYALMEAYQRGYNLALWVDASFWARSNVDGLFEMIHNKNVVVQSSGFLIGQWTSDKCLQHMSIDREEAFDMVLFSGGLIGLNFKNYTAMTFFEEFYKYAKTGLCFRGAWKNRENEVSNNKRVLGHRHDMSVGSILMNKMNLPIQPNNTLFNYYKWHEGYKKKKDLSGVYFICEGGERRIAWNKRLKSNPSTG